MYCNSERYVLKETLIFGYFTLIHFPQLFHLSSLDFIGKNYYGTLTAGDSSDLNVGGVTQTNNMISGVSGCKGEAVVEPPFKRGDIM